MVATAPRIRVGPDCHGEPVPLDDLDRCTFDEGHAYEIIDGRWYVAPIAGFPEQFLEHWLRLQFDDFAAAHPEVVGWVTNKCRVFVPGRPRLTVPEPDIGLYREDLATRFAEDEALNWDDFSPFVVAEVLVAGDERKDLVRNVDLYFQVPSIQEYWVLDGRENPREPVLHVRRRWGTRWVVREIAFGGTYTTRTLPGFELVVDPTR